MKSDYAACCPGIVWETIQKRAHTQLVREHSATFVYQVQQTFKGSCITSYVCKSNFKLQWELVICKKYKPKLLRSYKGASFLCESTHEKYVMTDESLQIWWHWNFFYIWWDVWAKMLKSTSNKSFSWVIFATVLKDTAKKNVIETDIISYGFLIVHQGMWGSQHVANSDAPICMHASPSSANIRKHSLHMAQSFFFWWEFCCTRQLG